MLGNKDQPRHVKTLELLLHFGGKVNQPNLVQGFSASNLLFGLKSVLSSVWRYAAESDAPVHRVRAQRDASRDVAP